MSRVRVGAPSAQCDGKHRYQTMSSALRVIRGVRGANAYRCPHCHSFHIGHVAKPPPVRPVRRPMIHADDLDI
jgi:hypothetical protein